MDAERAADRLAWQASELDDWNAGAHERAKRREDEPDEDTEPEPEAAPEALTLDWTAP